MKLTKEEAEFLQEWEINRKRNRVIIRTVAWPVFMSIFTELIKGFDATFHFHTEDISVKSFLFRLLTFSVIWILFTYGQFYFNEKEYKKLLEKKTGEK